MAYTGKKPIDHTDVTQSQSMTVTDDLTISGDTSLVDLAMTGGITFDSRTNALDDYEEGTFTPVLADAISGGNTSSTVGLGKYTKIGRIVHMEVYFANIVTTGMTSGNSMHLRNLPFANNASGVNTFSTGFPRVDNVTFGSGYMSFELVSGGGTYGIFKEVRSGTTDLVMTVSDFNSGSADLFMGMTYTAA